MKRRMRVVVSAVLLAAGALLLYGCSVPSEKHGLAVDGRDRAYRLYVPPNLPPDRPAPFVLSLHGGGGSGRQIERAMRFDELADREGFIVAYPDAWERNWNDGRGSDAIESQRERVDDVAFLLSVVDDVRRRHSVDDRRIFVTGVSNGAFMSHLLAFRCPEVFAAAAPVIGGMSPSIAADFCEGPPVAMLVIQGTEDPLVPYHGGAVLKNRGSLVPTLHAMELWARRNGSDGTSVETDLPDLDPGDGCRAKRREWGGADMKAPVVLTTIEGGGHTWPGGPQYLPEAWIGRASADFVAEEMIWEFFRRVRP
jgi:polyhydroxybutyrate depolymerase